MVAPSMIRAAALARGVPVAFDTDVNGAALGEHLSLAELGRIGRREWSIVEAAVPSIVALLLGGIGLLEPRTAVWLAVALGLVVLGAQGIVFARVERLGLTATVGVVAGTMTIGDLVLVNAFMIQLYIPLNFLGVLYREIKQSLLDMDKMFRLLAENREVDDKPDALCEAGP